MLICFFSFGQIKFFFVSLIVLALLTDCCQLVCLEGSVSASRPSIFSAFLHVMRRRPPSFPFSLSCLPRLTDTARMLRRHCRHFILLPFFTQIDGPTDTTLSLPFSFHPASCACCLSLHVQIHFYIIFSSHSSLVSSLSVCLPLTTNLPTSH